MEKNIKKDTSMKGVNLMIKLVCYFLFLLVLSQIECFSQSSEGTIVDVPQPVAHYPLDVATYSNYEKIKKKSFQSWRLRPYDVSGNGKHGTFSYVKKPYHAMALDIEDTSHPLNRIGYSVRAIEVKSGDNIKFTIPDPYGNQAQEYEHTQTFWMYWENNEYPKRIYSTNNVVIYVKGNSLIIFRKSEDMSITSISYEVDFYEGNPWKFIALRQHKNGSEVSYTLFVMGKDENTNNYAENSETTSSTDIVISNEDFSPQIFDATFSGKAFGFRFYDQNLTYDQIDAVRQADVDYVSGEYKNMVNELYYPSYGAYAYFPMNSAETATYESKYLDCMNTQAEGCDASKNGSNTQNVSNFSRSGMNGVQFEGDGGIVLTTSNFKRYLKDYDGKKGLTFSFWTYLPQVISHPELDMLEPFTAEDAKYTMFDGLDSQGKSIFSMSRAKDILNVTRHMKNDASLPWDLWFYKPASFEAMSGWVHIVLAYDELTMRAYVIPKDAQEIMGRNNQFGLFDQDLCAVKEFAIGNMKTGGHAIGNIDEFRIYNYPLNLYDVEALHHYENQKLFYSVASTASLRTNEVEESATKKMRDEVFALFPNPAVDNLNIRFELERDSEVRIEMYDMSGKQVLQQNLGLIQSGINERTLHNLYGEVGSGLYILKFKSDFHNMSRQLMIH